MKKETLDSINHIRTLIGGIYFTSKLHPLDDNDREDLQRAKYHIDEILGRQT